MLLMAGKESVSLPCRTWRLEPELSFCRTRSLRSVFGLHQFPLLWKMVQSPHVEASTFQRDDLNDRSDLWKRLEYPSLPSGEVWMPLAVHRALRVLASAHLSSLLQIHVIPVILLQLRIRLVLIHPPAISPLDCVFSASLPSPFTFCLPPILKTDSPPQTPQCHAWISAGQRKKHRWPSQTS